jgi:DNA-binding PadR family transcriptional regulator
VSEELTRLEAVTLGLLVDQPTHPYALRARLAPGLPPEGRPNDGVIRPLLARLEQRGLLRHQRDRVDGRERKVFSATAAGRRAFAAWLDGDQHEGRELGAGLFLDQPFLKLLFAGHMSPEQQRAKLEDIRRGAAARREALERLGRQPERGVVGAELVRLGIEHEQATVEVADRLRRALGD